MFNGAQNPEPHSCLCEVNNIYRGAAGDIVVLYYRTIFSTQRHCVISSDTSEIFLYDSTVSESYLVIHHGGSKVSYFLFSFLNATLLCSLSAVPYLDMYL